MPLKWAVAACAVLFVGVGAYLAPLHFQVVALQFTFTPGAFATVLKAWSPEDVERFRQHLIVDGLLLLSYGAAGYLAVTGKQLFAPLSRLIPLTTWALLLPAAAAFDACENILHWWLTSAEVLSGVIKGPPLAYLAAGLCATFKWLGIASFVAGAISARMVFKA